ncbi:MAG: hypothetical protein ACPGWM_06140, partial [Flavobacteriales bacterium]
SLTSGVSTVYDACGGNELACDFVFGSGESMDLVFDTNCGQTYFVQVSGYSNFEVGTLAISFTEDLTSTCNDIAACNYSACADLSGVCVYPDGCVDVTACNYNPSANCDDGSCTYDGGLDISAINWVLAIADCSTFDLLFPPEGDVYVLAGNGDLIFNGEPIPFFWASCGNDIVLYQENEIQFTGTYINGIIQFTPLTGSDCFVFMPIAPGCNDEIACNYDPAINFNDGSCLYTADACGVCGGSGTLAGCTEAEACNFNPAADCNDGSCEYITCAGCTDPTACNYDSVATFDNSSCSYPGCIYVEACNYNPAAGCPDGSCEFSSCVVLGCTYETSPNFNPLANDDDGSCTFDGSMNTCPADFNDDGEVNASDLLTFLGEFGTICP